MPTSSLKGKAAIITGSTSGIGLGIADLHLWDGMGHCFIFDVDIPESQEAFAVIAHFFDHHLGRRPK